MTKQNRWNFDTTYATGDILYASSTSALSKLPVGADGKVLTVSSGLPSWQTAVGPGTINPLNYSYFEEFIHTALSFGIMGNNSVGGGSTGSGALAAPIVGTATNPGLVTVPTGTTSTGATEVATCYSSGSTAGVGFLFGAGSYTLEWVMQIPTLSTGTQRFTITMGFKNTGVTTGTLTNGAWFQYVDNVNSGAWQVICRQSSTSTTNNTASTVDTNFHHYKIAVNAAATSVSFYIDGAEVTNSPITTNIPSTTGQEVGAIFSIIKSVGSTSRSFTMDWYGLQIALSGARN